MTRRGVVVGASTAFLGAVAVLAVVSNAGDLNPPAGSVQPTGVTLTDIHNAIVGGQTSTIARETTTGLSDRTLSAGPLILEKIILEQISSSTGSQTVRFGSGAIMSDIDPDIILFVDIADIADYKDELPKVIDFGSGLDLPALFVDNGSGGPTVSVSAVYRLPAS